MQDSQLGEERVHIVDNYIRKGKLWQAFTADKKMVLLVDKADIEFPNDLLQKLNEMEFHVYETGETVHAVTRPIVIITSNNEKELPDAFLRHCFFHYIQFTNPEILKQIVQVHHGDIKESLLVAALTQFYELREQPELKKKSSTSEVLDWLKRLLAKDLSTENLQRDGAFLKKEQDVHLFKRLAFMARSGR